MREHFHTKKEKEGTVPKRRMKVDCISHKHNFETDAFIHYFTSQRLAATACNEKEEAHTGIRDRRRDRKTREGRREESLQRKKRK